MNHEEAISILASCRQRIDEVDRKLLRLLNDRTRIVGEIASVKERMAMPIYEPKREDEIYRNVAEHNAGPLPEDSARRIFERIIDEMRHLQRLRKEGAAAGDRGES